MKESTINKYKLVIEAYYQNGMNGFKAVESVYGEKTKQTTEKMWNRINKEMSSNVMLIEYSENCQKDLKEAFSHEKMLNILTDWIKDDDNQTRQIKAAEMIAKHIDFYKTKDQPNLQNFNFNFGIQYV